MTDQTGMTPRQRFEAQGFRALEKVVTAGDLHIAQRWQQRQKAITPDSSLDELRYLLILHESTSRPHDLVEVHRNVFRRRGANWDMAGPTFWRWVAAEWAMFDRIPHERYRRAFAWWQSDWSPDCMSHRDRYALTCCRRPASSCSGAPSEGGSRA